MKQEYSRLQSNQKIKLHEFEKSVKAINDDIEMTFQSQQECSDQTSETIRTRARGFFTDFLYQNTNYYELKNAKGHDSSQVFLSSRTPSAASQRAELSSSNMDYMLSEDKDYQYCKGPYRGQSVSSSNSLLPTLI